MAVLGSKNGDRSGSMKVMLVGDAGEPRNQLRAVLAARCAWRFVDLFERLGLTMLEPRFVLDQYNPAHPLTDKAIESTLAKPIFAKIPLDPRTFETIEMKAVDLFETAPNSALAHAVLDLARKMMPQVEAAPVAEHGFISRLKSAFGAH